MDMSQSDRDSLRASQHKLNSNTTIGNIIEHKVQCPKKYRQSSNNEQCDNEESLKIEYKSVYYSSESENLLPPINEVKELELPDSLKEGASNMWLNMDQLEFDKLEWMSTKAEKAYQEQMKDTTLFDEEGRALPSIEKDCEAESVSRKPKHDIKSLVKLLDSAYHPQVTYALNVIRKIASLATMGYYDAAFDENIHDVLLKSCLLRVRHQMDSPNETTCQSALKCMQALLCNTRVDEVILDRIHPLISEHRDSNLWLLTEEMESKKFTSDMKDLECVEIDPIFTLIERTDILTRFNHLLRVKLSVTYSECILDILIRLARHSIKICYLISRNSLLSEILDKFLPKSITTQNQLIRHLSVKALKLFRIIAQAAIELEETLLEQPIRGRDSLEIKIPQKIVPITEAYFFIDCNDKKADQDRRLHIETLRIMKVLSKMKKFRPSIISLMAMGGDLLGSRYRALSYLKSTSLMESKISFDWQYAAHLIDLTGFLSRDDNYQEKQAFRDDSWKVYIKPVLLQWLSDLIRAKIIPHLDISIAISAGIQHYRTFTYVHYVDCTDLEKVLFDAQVDGGSRIENSNVNFFRILAKTASETSQLPNFIAENGKLRDPTGLPSFGSLCFNNSNQHVYKLSPLVDNNSPFILLDIFISQLKLDKVSTKQNLKVFIDNVDIVRYIKSITRCHEFPMNYEILLQHSLVAQFEIQTIARSILMLGKYYLEVAVDEEQDEPTTDLEPLELAQARVENYSNICHYAISVIGLMSSGGSVVLRLKDSLFGQILLNSRLQSRVTVENFAKVDRLSEPITRSQFLNGAAMKELLNDSYLHVLTPIYMSFEQFDRFWIFQPIIEYYFGQQSGLEACKKQKEGTWFEHYVVWRMNTFELAACKDDKIISIILTFNSAMMFYSPAHKLLVVRPNIENYLCLIGTTFLSDDLFLDKEVSVALEANLKILLRDCIVMPDGKINAPFKDASSIIKPLKLTLSHFFDKLVNQFEAVSYGDAAFSNFLLLFIAPSSDKVFRRKLFQEKAETCLSQFKLGTDQLWTPEQFFFGEVEKDVEIKSLIRRSQPIIPKNSFLQRYIAIHSGNHTATPNYKNGKIEL